MNTLTRYIAFIIALFAVSCSEIIEFSPYDTDIQTSNLNVIYTKDLNSKAQVNSDTLSFALFSDSHYHYDKLEKIVSSINKRKNIAFAVACGDITDSGLAREYEYYWKQVRKLDIPIISVIGNHDCLSNGYTIYKRMFGDPNFHFVWGNYKFIAFNSVVWENGNKSPDFEWLNKEVENSDQKCIILTHIPPFGDQFTDEYRKKYYNIASLPEVILNIHGHEHHFRDTLIDNKRYVVTEESYQNDYYLVHLVGDNAILETVNF